jgi:hypothetical protein
VHALPRLRTVVRITAVYLSARETERLLRIAEETGMFEAARRQYPEGIPSAVRRAALAKAVVWLIDYHIRREP